MCSSVHLANANMAFMRAHAYWEGQANPVEAKGHDGGCHGKEGESSGTGGREPPGISNGGEASGGRSILHHWHVLDGLQQQVFRSGILQLQLFAGQDSRRCVPLMASPTCM